VVSTQYRGQPERPQYYSSGSHRVQNEPSLLDAYDMNLFNNPEEGDFDAEGFFD